MHECLCGVLIWGTGSVVLFLDFWGPHWGPQRLQHFVFPSGCTKAPLPYILTSICCFLDDSHPDWVRWNWHFPKDFTCFSEYLLVICTSSFENSSVHWLFIDWMILEVFVFNFYSSLCTLDTNPIYYIVNIFSPTLYLVLTNELLLIFMTREVPFTYNK